MYLFPYYLVHITGMVSLSAVFSVLLVYGCCIFLHVMLPAFNVTGYCCDNATLQPLKYRLNGFPVLVLLSFVFYYLPDQWKTLLYDEKMDAFITANLVGFGFSIYLYVRGGREKYARCVTIDQLTNVKAIKFAEDVKLSPVSNFFLGHEWNPRFYNVDSKMILYLIGAVLLFCNILSAATVQIQLWNGNMSNAMKCVVVCFSWFLGDYMLGEKVHLYTYDLFAEKMGFKLAWGCFVFYPFYYALPAYAVVYAQKDNDISTSSLIGIFALFLCGWVITRGANMQKFAYRVHPASTTFFFGLVHQKVIPGSKILCSGWWGIARHFNYFGEIIQGVAISLPGFLVNTTIYGKLLALSYPIYYSILFVTREIDDNAVCRLKYGAAWDEYEKIVPYRICPFLW